MLDALTYTSGPITAKLKNHPKRIIELEDEAGNKTGKVKIKGKSTPTFRQGNHSVSVIQVKEGDTEWLADVFDDYVIGKFRDGYWQGGVYYSNDPYGKASPDFIAKIRLVRPEYVEQDGEQVFQDYRYNTIQ